MGASTSTSVSGCDCGWLLTIYKVLSNMASTHPASSSSSSSSSFTTSKDVAGPSDTRSQRYPWVWQPLSLLPQPSGSPSFQKTAVLTNSTHLKLKTTLHFIYSLTSTICKSLSDFPHHLSGKVAFALSTLYLSSSKYSNVVLKEDICIVVINEHLGVELNL